MGQSDIVTLERSWNFALECAWNCQDPPIPFYNAHVATLFYFRSHQLSGNTGAANGKQSCRYETNMQKRIIATADKGAFLFVFARKTRNEKRKSKHKIEVWSPCHWVLFFFSWSHLHFLQHISLCATSAVSQAVGYSRFFSSYSSLRCTLTWLIFLCFLLLCRPTVMGSCVCSKTCIEKALLFLFSKGGRAQIAQLPKLYGLIQYITGFLGCLG